MAMQRADFLLRTEALLEERLSQTEKSPFVLAIDGRCASGKTTLAACLGEKYDCTVIHMDDFFLRPGQRTRERLEEPGGNVDRERFLTEVLAPLSKGESFSYRPFNCAAQTLGEPVAAAPKKLCIIEGSYSLHPEMRGFYDLCVFLTLSPDEQMLRITARNGSKQAEVFRKVWIPLEERYFDYYKISSHCDLLLSPDGE